MKDFKFLSALALTGMLTAGIMGTVSASTPVGLFAKGELVEDAAVVPFVLENKDDRVTVDTLKTTYNATNITGDKNGVVGTGTTFKVNGETYTALVYGDVSGDGVVTTTDATQVQLNIANQKELTKTQQEAGNVIRKDGSKLTTTDATNIQLYVAQGKAIPDQVPEAQKPVIEAKYDFTVNENNTVNDTNKETSEINIKTKNGRVEEETEFELYYIDEDGKEQLISTNDLKIAQYADESGEISVNLSSVVTAIGANSEEKEQQVTLVLKEKDSDEVVGTTTITINTIHPEAVKISARREGTEQAGLKFESKFGKDIVKVYYIIDESTKSNVSDVTEADNVKTATVENNKFDSILNRDTALENSTTTGKHYKVYFVVENSVGNQSSLYTAVVPNDSSAKQEEKVTDVVVDDSSDNKIKVKFTEPTEKTTVGGYTITIYDENGNIIDEVSASKGAGATGVDITNKIPEGGKYTVTVITKGDAEGASKDSDETEPVEFEVSQLAEVTGIHFETDEETDDVYIKWDEYSDAENEAFSGYTIKIYKYDPATKNYEASPKKTENNVDKKLTEIKITDVDSFAAEENTRYKAVISANSSKGKVLASGKTESEKDYFNLKVAMIPTTKSDTEVEIAITDKDKIEKLGDTVTYDVEVWSEIESDSAEKHFEKTDIKKNVIVDKNGKIIINGLKGNTKYKFVLIAHIDGDEAEGRSDKSDEVKTLTALPSLNGKVVIKSANSEKDTVGGKICSPDTSKLYIDGVIFDFSNSNYKNYYDPMGLLNGEPGVPVIIDFIRSLNENDTIVSVTKEKITIKAANVATNGVARKIKAGGKVLEIIGNINQQDIKAETANASEVILNGGLFKVDKTSTSKFTLNNNVKVLTDISANNEKVNAVVTAGSTATVDNIEIHSTAALDTTISINESSKRVLTIKEVGNDTITINNKSGKELIVEFDGDATIGENQLGKVTVSSNADVTITTKNNATVGAEVSVSTTNGSIDVSSETLTGTKDVTVTTDKTAINKKITARTKLTSPVELTNIEIIPYTVQQLKALRDDNTTIADAPTLTQSMLTNANTDEKLAQIVDYFNTFKSLFNTGAKVTAEANAENVTITLPAGSVTTLNSATIEGLK